MKIRTQILFSTMRRSLRSHPICTYNSLHYFHSSSITQSIPSKSIIEPEKTVHIANEQIISAPESVAILLRAIKLSENGDFLMRKIIGIVRKSIDDPLKSALLNYSLIPTSQKPIFSAIINEILASKDLDDSQKIDSVFSVLSTISKLQKFRLQTEIHDYFQRNFTKYQTILKNENEILNRVWKQFEESSDWFFSRFKMDLNMDFYSSFLKLLSPQDYSDLLIALLDCNMSLKNIDHDPFFRCLISKSTKEDLMLVSGISWKSSLNTIQFDLTTEDHPGISKVINDYLALKQKDINEIYFDYKFSHLYSIESSIKLIHKLSTDQTDMATSVTSKLLQFLSTEASPYSDSYFQEANSIAEKKDTRLKSIINLSWKQIDSLKANKNLNRYSINTLSQFLASLVPYTLHNVGPEFVLEILSRIQLINENLQKSQKLQNLRIDTDAVIILLVTGFRQLGLVDESLRLLNLLLNLSSKNRKLYRAQFRYNNTIYKDLISEFLLIVKHNYDDPRIFLSYYVEFMTNFKDMSTDVTVSNETLFEFYTSHPQITDLNNNRSSFFLLNELGIIRLVYEEDCAPLAIDFQDSQQTVYYTKNLLRANPRPELRNSKLTLTSLSICYSVIFDYLKAQDKLTAPLLDQLYSNYISTVEKAQSCNLSNYHPLNKVKISTIITSQFMHQFLELGEVELADHCLKNFLQIVKFEPRNVSINCFERLIYKYALLMYRDKYDSEVCRSKIISWIRLMNTTFGYPLGFYTKFSLLLMTQNDNAEASRKYYNDLTRNGGNYDAIRHYLLIKIAKENGWPLPKYLEHLDFSNEVIESLDSVVEKSSWSQFSAEDVTEFDNDGLETFYDELDSRESIKPKGLYPKGEGYFNEMIETLEAGI